jgi:sugar phosphate isomerase/epimerase
MAAEVGALATSERRPLNRLALDHLTATDTTPSQLVAVAAESGCPAVCLFLQSMDVLPRMPRFDLIGDAAERRHTRARCQALGVAIDLVYPFTLSGRSDVRDFVPALETAAWLGARAVNTLIYDRDPARRLDTFAAFCRLAVEHGLDVVVEFYPQSQVHSLAEALALVANAGVGDHVGVNVDLLHLMRSRGVIADLASAPAELITYAQFCDGDAEVGARHAAFEASSQRRLPGEGVFDLGAFAAALPPGLCVSVELPQDDALARGVPPIERARSAVDGVRRALRAASARMR